MLYVCVFVNLIFFINLFCFIINSIKRFLYSVIILEASVAKLQKAAGHGLDF